MNYDGIMDGVLTIKVNLGKVDPAFVIKGRKGDWLDLVLIETPDNEWNDFMAVQDIGYENRISGKKGPILGNGKIRRKES